MESDPKIQVNILTPTSERKSVMNEPIQEITIGIIIEQHIPRRRYRRRHLDYYDIILNRSWADNELKRNNNIELNINTRECKCSDLTENCHICQDKFKSTDIIATLRCDHCFHSNCIMEWGKYKQECPLCRAQIPTLN